MGASGSISTSNGTAALILCLKALGIGAAANDEVIVPTYICRSVMQAVEAVGATPVLCDSGEFWNATEATIADRFTARTKAVVTVNIFGISAQLASLRKHPYLIIEDHCQSFGLPEPIFGVAAFYSFHATKCFTSGEGGAAAFPDREAASRAAKLRADYVVPGALSDLQAALALSQLARYDDMLSRRRKIAKQYFDALPHHLTENFARPNLTTYSSGFRFA